MEKENKWLLALVVIILSPIAIHFTLFAIGVLPSFELSEGYGLAIGILAGLFAYAMAELPTDH